MWLNHYEAERIMRQREEDVLRQAERERLVRQVLVGRDRRDHLARQALTWLGQRLVVWGCRLLEQYGAVGATIHPVACQPTLANR